MKKGVDKKQILCYPSKVVASGTVFEEKCKKLLDKVERLWYDEVPLAKRRVPCKLNNVTKRKAPAGRIGKRCEPKLWVSTV